MMADKQNSSKTGISRRFFFHHLLAESISIFGEVQGKPQLLLSDIPNLPDKTIRQMAPIFIDSDKYFIKDACLWERDDKGNSPVELHGFDTHQTFIVDCFDGHSTIDEISHFLVDQFTLSEDIAFKKVKSTFIFLTRYSICCPFQVHER